jgi:hypothetical protein
LVHLSAKVRDKKNQGPRNPYRDDGIGINTDFLGNAEGSSASRQLEEIANVVCLSTSSVNRIVTAGIIFDPERDFAREDLDRIAEYVRNNFPPENHPEQ